MPNSNVGGQRGGGGGGAAGAPDSHRAYSVSEYHNLCVPAVDRERAAAVAAAMMRRAAATSTSGTRSSTISNLIHGDPLCRDRFWQRAIRVEKQAAKGWSVIDVYDIKGAHAMRCFCYLRQGNYDFIGVCLFVRIIQ